MAEDAQGLEVSSTSGPSLARYDAAIRELFFFREGVVAQTAAALAEDPLTPMPNVLAAYLALLGTEPADVAAAGQRFARFLDGAGHYDRSENIALQSVELNPDDVWGIHAVAHTYEMQGRFGDGMRYYDARLLDWSAGNFFTVHNWWHYALYALEAGRTDRALEIYDASIQPGETVMELLDASALLWRLYLDGDRQQERWAALAPAWGPKVAEPYYSFNDMHAVMAYIGGGRLGDARELIEARQNWLATPHPGNGNQQMTATVGLPVARALLAFGEGRYSDVVDLLYPIRHRINEFGGSHAQRDAVQRTLLEGALRAGRTDIARELISERINVRPCSPFNWLKQARLADLLADPSAASAARTEATRLMAEAGSRTGGEDSA